MNFLPIVLTAYNRPEHLKHTLSSLAECKFAEASDLYIFIDGPITDINVDACCRIAKLVCGFKSVTVEVHPKNIGLANNVISSVSRIMHQNQGAIVLEDDMLVSYQFIEYMNKVFHFYHKNQFVGCVTGYCPNINGLSEHQYDVFASTRSSTWGWAMTSEDWFSINWDKAFFQALLLDQDFLKRFDEAGNDRKNILSGYVQGRLNIWGIRRGAWQVLNHKLTIYPKYSLLTNIGFDGSGQNCGLSTQLQDNYDDHFLPEIFEPITCYQASQLPEQKIKAFYDRN